MESYGLDAAHYFSTPGKLIFHSSVDGGGVVLSRLLIRNNF